MKIINSTENYLTKKYVFDGFEHVFINRDNKKIVCLSCMKGCSLNCNFCKSHERYDGMITNTELEESFKKIYYDEQITSDDDLLISFMGSGEPMLCMMYINSFLNALNNEHIYFRWTYSTIGLRKKNFSFLYSIWTRPFKIQLSLHSPFDDDRRKMFGDIVCNLNEIMNEFYTLNKRLRIDLECNYILMNGVNDTDDHIQGLIDFMNMYRFCKLKICQFNPYNNIIESERKRKFITVLQNNYIDVEEYYTDGVDINAACGQLY